MTKRTIPRSCVLLVLLLGATSCAGDPAGAVDEPDDQGPDAGLATGGRGSGGRGMSMSTGGGGAGGLHADAHAPAAVDAAEPDAPVVADAAPAGAADSAPVTVTDPGSEGDGKSTINGPYDPPPEMTLQPGVTAGKMTPVMVAGTLLAGRQVTVYTPAGYVAMTPAPFIVLQDGNSYMNNFKLNTVLDNMIAKHELPAMIAIFVPNGGAAKRSFEYDTLSDLYTRFVLEEVLPAVEKALPIKLTTDPDGRATGGHSSGGIAAFSMGWYRPDQFRRILSNSGSFVSIRGGDKYPGIVDMTPAKPLRVFLSVGSKDNESPRWQKGNENMATALAAKAYHYRFVLLNGGTHAQSYPASIMPETLRWLWRGYPIAGK
jgi:enterochelin esterase-like enzyme